jgi:hypothetical protein
MLARRATLCSQGALRTFGERSRSKSHERIKLDLADASSPERWLEAVRASLLRERTNARPNLILSLPYRDPVGEGPIRNRG